MRGTHLKGWTNNHRLAALAGVSLREEDVFSLEREREREKCYD